MDETNAGINLRTEENVTITCFPYGMNRQGKYTLAAKESLNLIQDFRPTIPRIIWLLSLTLSVLAAIYGIAKVLSPLEEKVAPFVLFFLTLFPVLIFNTRPVFFDNASGLLDKLLEIQSTDSGLSLISISQLSKNIPWKNLKEVKLKNSKSKDENQITIAITYRLTCEQVNIPLSAIHSRENWLSLAASIRSKAPHVTIDNAITQAFKLPSADTSFTEIWLDSLAQAPQQNTFLTLSKEYLLRNGRYSIKGKLGQGGQGQAYLGDDLSSDKTVVIKEFLLPMHGGNPAIQGMIRQLEEEAHTLQKIAHPQITHFVDFFQEKHKAYLVLEEAEGENLKQWLARKGKPAPETICLLLKEMCEILNYLHSLNPPIIHRDFTPENLIINTAHKLTLIDFTIAETLGQASGLPPAGKPAYMPPEQFRGEASERSDIYALGGTLYFLLTGQDPIALEQPDLRESKANNQESRKLKEPTALLNEIIYTCRAQSTAERYESVQEIIGLLPA